MKQSKNVQLLPIQIQIGLCQFQRQYYLPTLYKMSLILYFHPANQPSRAVLALLRMGHIKFEIRVIDLVHGQIKSPQYLQLNPFGTVPFIIHNELSLSESNAIMVHLCWAFPDQLKGFYGSCPRERDLINQYLSWYQSTYRPVFLKPVKLKCEAAFLNKKLSVIAYSEAYAQLKDMLYLLEKLLSQGSGYLVGQSLSIADLLFCCETTNVQILKMDLSEWSYVSYWYESIQKMPIMASIHNYFLQNIETTLNLLEKIEWTE